MRNRVKKLLAISIAALVMLSGFASAMPEFSSLPLHSGDSGEDVLLLQGELASLGLYTDEPSGVYDAATVAAVKKLQALIGVTADGMFGTRTLKAYIRACDSGALSAPPAAAAADSAFPLKGLVIGIDPGHQAQEDTGLELIEPGSSRTKQRMTGGVTGVKTGAAEHAVNLQIAEKLTALLEAAGARVVATRSSSDVTISNMERALAMNAAEVDCWIRLHCDYSSSKKKTGAYALVPSLSANPDIYDDSLELGKEVLSCFCAATGAKKLSMRKLSTQTGFNWSQRPVATIEMGFLSNASDDVKLSRDSYQNACADGICNGLIQYFADR